MGIRISLYAIEYDQFENWLEVHGEKLEHPYDLKLKLNEISKQPSGFTHCLTEWYKRWWIGSFVEWYEDTWSVNPVDQSTLRMIMANITQNYDCGNSNIPQRVNFPAILHPFPLLRDSDTRIGLIDNDQLTFLLLAIEEFFNRSQDELRLPLFVPDDIGCSEQEWIDFVESRVLEIAAIQKLGYQKPAILSFIG